MTLHQFIYGGGLILSLFAGMIVLEEYGEVPASIPMGFFCVFALLLIIHPDKKPTVLVGEEDLDRPRSVWEAFGPLLITLHIAVCVVAVGLAIYAVTYLIQSGQLTYLVAVAACVGLSTIMYFSGVFHHFVEKIALQLSFPLKDSA